MSRRKVNAPGRITAWQFRDLSLELRHNPVGAVATIPRHSHEQYQIIIAEHMIGEYVCRGATHVAPPGSLVVFHPGEVHTARGLQDIKPLQPLRSLYASPALLADIAQERLGDAARSPSASPFLPMPLIQDPQTFRLLRNLHALLATPAPCLEKDVALVEAFVQLVERYAERPPRSRVLTPERASVRRVREYLHDHYAENVSLARLSEVAALSPCYLCRVFRHEVGLPPQEYQVQVRVARARALLAQGKTSGDVAALTGFADQSHLTRHFKRLVGVTPGRYHVRNINEESARSF